MKAELKEAWVTALRSGEYAQTKYSLCRVKADSELPVGFCCLGVLVDVDPNAEWDGSVPSGDRKTFFGGVGTLGYSYQAEVGLDVSDAEILMAMNDDHSNSFSEIADWIDENIPVD